VCVCVCVGGWHFPGSPLFLSLHGLFYTPPSLTPVYISTAVFLVIDCERTGRLQGVCGLPEGTNHAGLGSWCAHREGYTGGVHRQSRFPEYFSKNGQSVLVARSRHSSFFIPHCAFSHTLSVLSY
jgi:hypothetical protein